MPDSFYYLIEIAAVAFLAPWILGPIAVYFTQKTPIPEFLSPSDAEMAPLTGADFEHRSRAVEELGFERVCNVQWKTASTTMYSRIFCNLQTQESAHVADICADNKYLPAPSVKAHIVEFVTDFDDGRQVNTSNANLPRVFEYGPEKEVHYLSGANDPETLYGAHRYLTSRADGEIKPLPPPHLMRQEFESESIDIFRRQEESGILYFDHETQAFRPTVMGAITMAWKLVWPVGMIRRFAMRRNARRVLASARV